MLLAGMILHGCSSSFTVVPDTADDRPKSIRYDQLNRRLQGHDVRLFLVDGRHIDGMSVSVGYDTIRFREGTDDTLHCIPTRLIIEIEQTDRLRGTIEGVAFGGLIGGAAGLGLIGAVVHPEGEGGPGLLWVVLGGACAGATTGIVAGMIKGHTITYRLGTPMPSTQKAALGARLTEIPGSLDSPPFHREFVNVQE
jgi:hypothetical protein